MLDRFIVENPEIQTSVVIDTTSTLIVCQCNAFDNDDDDSDFDPETQHVRRAEAICLALNSTFPLNSGEFD